VEARVVVDGKEQHLSAPQDFVRALAHDLRADWLLGLGEVSPSQVTVAFAHPSLCREMNIVTTLARAPSR
jgi:hypothetical protein